MSDLNKLGTVITHKHKYFCVCWKHSIWLSQIIS